MYKKLVKLSPENGWGFSELDPIKVKRTALKLQEYVVQNIDSLNDQYGIREQIVPLYEGAISGEISTPVNFDDLPLKYLLNEGVLPRGFEKVWSDFCIAISSTPTEMVEEIQKGDEIYGYMEFEEPGDWPELIQQREMERREKRHRED